jgi:hypothetical protein
MAMLAIEASGGTPEKAKSWLDGLGRTNPEMTPTLLSLSDGCPGPGCQEPEMNDEERGIYERLKERGLVTDVDCYDEKYEHAVRTSLGRKLPHLY